MNVAAVHTCIREFVAATSGQVRGLWFSSAMHSLMGLDRHGDPLTPSITWADSRARPQAERNQAALGALELHKRTRTPAHPMAPLSKLIWFSEQEPALFARVRHWVGVKNYMSLRMCDELVTDHSLASGSGLLDIGCLHGIRRLWNWLGLTRHSRPSSSPPPQFCRGFQLKRSRQRACRQRRK